MLSFNADKNELLFQERLCPTLRVIPRHRLVCPHCNRLLEAELGTDLTTESGLTTEKAMAKYDWMRRWSHAAVGGGMVLQNLSHSRWFTGMDGSRYLSCHQGGLYVGNSFAAAYAELWAEVCRAFATVERAMGRARTDALKKNEVPAWVTEHFGKPLECGTMSAHRPPEVLLLPKVAQLTGVTTLTSASGGRSGMLVNPTLFRDRLNLLYETGDPFTPERLVLALGGLGRSRPAQTALPTGLVVQPLSKYVSPPAAARPVDADVPPVLPVAPAAEPLASAAPAPVEATAAVPAAGPAAVPTEGPAAPVRRGRGRARRVEMSDLYVSLF